MVLVYRLISLALLSYGFGSCFTFSVRTLLHFFFGKFVIHGRGDFGNNNVTVDADNDNISNEGDNWKKINNYYYNNGGRDNYDKQMT